MKNPVGKTAFTQSKQHELSFQAASLYQNFVSPIGGNHDLLITTEGNRPKLCFHFGSKLGQI